MVRLMPTRVGILLSGSGSTYANLVDHITQGTLSAEIAVVVSSRTGVQGLERAQRNGHPHIVTKNPQEVTAALLAHQVDWVVMCGWLLFWDPPSPFIGRTINIHPALLPGFGGKGMYGIHVHRAVIAAQQKKSGCTIHQVSGAFDSGRIIAQAEVPVLPDDTPELLQARVQVAERELYPRVLQRLITSS